MTTYLIVFDNHPPLWVTAPSPTAAREKSQDHLLDYGHRVRITHVLTDAEEREGETSR